MRGTAVGALLGQDAAHDLGDLLEEDAADRRTQRPAPQQRVEADAERAGQPDRGRQARVVLGAGLDLRDLRLVHARVVGQLPLRPAPLLAQPPHHRTPPRRHAHRLLHRTPRHHPIYPMQYRISVVG
jgi:hypothetical protein